MHFACNLHNTHKQPLRQSIPSEQGIYKRGEVAYIEFEVGWSTKSLVVAVVDFLWELRKQSMWWCAGSNEIVIRQ